VALVDAHIRDQIDPKQAMVEIGPGADDLTIWRAQRRIRKN
jgi:hypothetical protein